MQTVAGLSALTRLRVGSNVRSDISMPRCKELACLHSTSIQDLTAFLGQVLEVGAGTAAYYPSAPSVHVRRNWSRSRHTYSSGSQIGSLPPHHHFFRVGIAVVPSCTFVICSVWVCTTVLFQGPVMCVNMSFLELLASLGLSSDHASVQIS